MKKILGLDIGTNSIGWSLIERDNKASTNDFLGTGKILGLGSRIIPMSQDILGKFDSGQSESPAAERTGYRGIRRLYQRDNLRRDRLNRVLNVIGFLPPHYAEQIDFEKRKGQFLSECQPKINYKKNEEDKYEFLFKDSFSEMIDLFKEKKFNQNVPYDWTIYYLRKKALCSKISKEEMAWIILNFNQKRGYYQLRGEEEEVEDGKTKEFHVLKVKEIIPTGEKIKEKDELYEVIFENGWLYDRQITAVDQWEGKTKEFIVTTTTKTDGEIKRSFKTVDPEKDWTAIKQKKEQDIEESKKHVGEYIFDALLECPSQKIRGKLIRTIERKFYKEELSAILKEQAKHHPEFNDKELYNKCLLELYPKNELHRDNICKRDLAYLFLEDIIFYQRPLKSKKSTISDCKHEFRQYCVDGEKYEKRLKALSKSHPYYEEFRAWQFVSNLKIYSKEKRIDEDITDKCLNDQSILVELFEFLHDYKEVEQKHIIKFLISKKKIAKEEEKNTRWNYVEDKKYPACPVRKQMLTRLKKAGVPDPKNFLNQNRQIDLWHLVYSINDSAQFVSALSKYAEKHNLERDPFIESFKKFPKIDSQYGAYSTKALSKLLPLMRRGDYWDFGQIDSHSARERIDRFITGEEDEKIKGLKLKHGINLDKLEGFQGLPVWLAEDVVYDSYSESSWNKPSDIDKYLKQFKQYSLRNPIVEQVVMETLRVVRDIWVHYGDINSRFFNEIHIELGREIKNPADKRKKLTDQVVANENTNDRIRKLLKELNSGGLDARAHSPSHQEILKIYEEGVWTGGGDHKGVSLSDIEKIRKESSPSKGDISKYRGWLEQGYTSPYTGAKIPLSKLFTTAYQIEHIIPQSRYYDDSLSNKVICESEVNQLKGNQTAYEFIKNHEGEIVNKSKIYSLQTYEDHVKAYFKGNRSKLKKLMSEEIPEGFIERQLNDTRYISKFVKGVLNHIVKEEDELGETSKHLIPVTGKITSDLKNDWGLNDKWNELIADRFKRLNDLNETKDYGFVDPKINAFRATVPDDLQKGFNKKRIDHRHHALDALVIACVNRDHIRYITSLNTESKKILKKFKTYENLNKETGEIETKTTPGTFRQPWSRFTMEAKTALENMVVSFKQNTRVINKTTNYYWKWVEENGDWKKKQVKQEGDNWTVRKPLHKETVSGKVSLKRKKKGEVSIANLLKTPELVVDKRIRKQIRAALILFKDDLKAVKKHFKTNPIELDGEIITKATAYEIFSATAVRTVLSKKFTRKQLDKITDTGIQKILNNHVRNYTNEAGEEDFSEAFLPEGLKELNEDIQTLNDGKMHAPICSVRIYEDSKKFSLGSNLANSKKYIEAAKGTNLFFAVYWDEENNKRNYESIPLKEVIEHQKQVAHLAKDKRTPFPVNQEKGQLLFVLSPNDLVYVPTDDELENLGAIELTNLSPAQVKRIYKVVRCSRSECYFKPAFIAKDIGKNENGKTGNAERAISLSSDLRDSEDGGLPMIKSICIPLSVNRVGHIKKRI